MTAAAGTENLLRVQGRLTVGLIMVAREDFLTCRPDQSAQEVASRNPDKFSFLPVVDDRQQVIGLYEAGRWFGQPAPETLVGDDYRPLSEDIVIGADASIFDFIRQADTHPTNLVISGNRVAGLVSLFDIQQLPVRAALFALVTSLEMAMALAIERNWPNPDDWMALLSEDRRAKVPEEIARAKQRDSFVSAIAFTQFGDKAHLIRKARALSGSGKSLKTVLADIQGLRNNLAHANSYADTLEEARNICQIVRNIYHLREQLLSQSSIELHV